ncbi:MAG: Gfo/Idh/MocA family oxidoreductase [Pirellulaceae bacterium]|nr:Gfo/Idh/MocA family oxidoreductase [Planctomycetales bacterium]
MPSPLELPYRPQDPSAYRPKIGLIGCGGITIEHLTAYRNANYDVVALCDLFEPRATQRRDEFYPDAAVYIDYRELLRRDDIEVVDIALHPPQRPPVVEAAIRAGKHVLSQKPFVLDLDEGQRLVELADQHQVRLAVNQNGRWAPHYSYIRSAIAAGLLGELSAVHMAVHWDHTWVQGTEFENVHHLILYDFAIHWFDLICCFFGNRIIRRVYASATSYRSQPVQPPLLAQAVMELDGAQASLAFDAFTPYQQRDTTYVAGSRGTISSNGPNLKEQAVLLTTEAGDFNPTLTGTWFPDGFHGTMAELLGAIEENREPSISARSNLDSLALCFAAIASAESGRPVVPGTVRELPPNR